MRRQLEQIFPEVCQIRYGEEMVVAAFGDGSCVSWVRSRVTGLFRQNRVSNP